MDHRRVAAAVEAAARALHESVRDQHQFHWEKMTETWRQDLRSYIQPSVIAALDASDRIVASSTTRSASVARPRLPSVGR
ncbi:hypothetical protein FG93_00115 [Bosea sp. LC85]|uniref:hypothetical protein n=1 Tax=Bosea sp. LC85 TaxID=1502851 RepID=UPI0004E463B6|nr:hypothetical protein [Bosea sp. LC85]KFC75975.1 hypothetical protein FG93_00115 [Bosea sp. LC85]